MKVDFLYFEGCPNHQPAVDRLRRVLAELGMDVGVEEVKVATQADAQRLGFLGSPTIQVDGVDIEPDSRNRTDYGLSCRLYGGEGLPSREMLVRALTGRYPARTVCRAVDDRTGMVAAGGSVVSAALASACCWLPWVLITIGLSAGGVSWWMGGLRKTFLGVAVVFLGAGFYRLYLRKPACKSGSACGDGKPNTGWLNHVMFWGAVGAVIYLSLYPHHYSGRRIDHKPVAQAATNDVNTGTIIIPIEGMTCPTCARRIENELAEVPGVVNASVSFPENRAMVSVDSSSPPSRESLIEVLARIGYKVASGR